MENKDFRELINGFCSSKDYKLHNQIIMELLDPLNLDIEYKKLCVGKNNIEKIRLVFSSFADFSDDELMGDFERQSVEQVGILTNKYFDKQDYGAFAKTIYALCLESLEVNEQDSEMVRNKEIDLIPEDSVLPFFLLEVMANGSVYDWKRERKIIEQSLTVLTVCFSAIYSCLEDQDNEQYEVFGD